MPSLAHQIELASCAKKLTVEEFLSENYVLDDSYVLEQKTDDCRYALQLRPNSAEINYLTSRRVSKVTNEYVEKQDWMPQLRDWDGVPIMLEDTVLDGGTYDPKNPKALASDVVHVMKSGAAGYRAFDIIRYRGKDMRSEPDSERRKVLIAVLEMLRKAGIPVELSHNTRYHGKAAKIELERLIRTGHEGGVLKDTKAIYGNGWTKVKRKSTYDVIITGYADPVSEIYAAKGWIGSFKIAQIDQETGKMRDLGQVKNMSDALRAEVSAKQKKYLGEVIEISAETRLKSGLFRNPSVISLRPDKNAKNCIFRPEDEA